MEYWLLGLMVAFFPLAVYWKHRLMKQLSTSPAGYKSRLIALLESLEVQKPEQAAELSEMHLRAIGKNITYAAKLGAKAR